MINLSKGGQKKKIKYAVFWQLVDNEVGKKRQCHNSTYKRSVAVILASVWSGSSSILFWPLAHLFILPWKDTKINSVSTGFPLSKHSSVLDSLPERSGHNVSLWNHVPGSLSDVTYLLLPWPCVGEEAFEQSAEIKGKHTPRARYTQTLKDKGQQWYQRPESECSRYFWPSREREGRDASHQMVFFVKCNNCCWTEMNRLQNSVWQRARINKS